MTIPELTARSTKRVMTSLKQASRPLSSIWPRSGEAMLGLFALVVVAIALLTYVTPLARIMGEFAPRNRYLAIAEGLLNPFRSPRLLLNSGLPIYDIEVDHTEMARIEAAIGEALQQGYMTDEQQVWARARFLHNGEDYNVRIRARGDLPPHWEGAKKSWRIRFVDSPVQHNGETIEEDIFFNGKEQINLIIPWDRDYVVAPFVNSLMREAGLVVPEDRYAVLRINGVVQGLYYEVEHFDNALLAGHRRPETTITGQNDRAMHFEQYTRYGTGVVSDSWYDLGVVNLQVESEGALAMQALQALQVLYDHSINPTPANFQRVQAVLDWEKYLRFRNVTTLLNTNHVRFGSDNFRLYLDPSRGLLEPIPWDAHLVRMPKEPGTIDFWNSKGPDEIQRATLMDPQLRLQRNQMLWEWVQDGGDSLLTRYNALHDEIRPLAWADVLSTPVHGFRMDGLKSDLTFNVRRMHKVLSLSNGNVIYRLEAPDRASLEAVALNFSGIWLQEIRLTDTGVFEGAYALYHDVNGNGELDELDTLVAETTTTNGSIHFVLDQHVLPEVRFGGDTIDGRYWTYMEPLAGRERYFLVGKLDTPDRHPLEWTAPDIQVRAENAVTGVDMPSGLIAGGQLQPDNSLGIMAYDASNILDLAAPELDLPQFLERNPQFSASAGQAGAAELRGSVVISGTVIVPKAAPLILQPGADVTMMPGATILAYGGLTAVGTEAQRISIHGDGSGRAWGSLAVVRPPQEVHLQYIDVSGGGLAQANGMQFSAGVSIHDGNLRLQNCDFRNMVGEDALNVKNGQVHIANCVFVGNASDGVDLDFSSGQITDSLFADNAGDGLESSGSALTVLNVHFENNGLRALNVAEDSDVTVANALFVRNQIGLATRDLSHTRVAYATFVENMWAMQAMRSRPYFGGASGEVVNSVFAGNQTLFEEDYFSQGQVSFQHSLTDDARGCPTCQHLTVRFQSSQDGDYRLRPDSPTDMQFETVVPDWEELNALSDLPALPGAFTTVHP